VQHVGAAAARIGAAIAETRRPVRRLEREEETGFMRQVNAAASPAARMVARRLLDLDHENGAYPGYQELARYTGLGEGTVRNAVTELYQLGAFIGARRPGRGNLVSYFAVPVGEWRHVTRDADTEPMSPETVTPGDCPNPSVSPPVSPSMSPPVSPETMHRSKKGFSREEKQVEAPTRGPVEAARAGTGQQTHDAALDALVDKWRRKAASRAGRAS
jgi:hypothetical protein